MNRIDRLTAILIHLQSKRIVTAKEIAARFGISIRTVYRDIRALEDAGVPIGAQAGEGYYIIDGYHLPPVMFTRDEAGSFIVAGKLIEMFSDPSVVKNYESSLFKIKSVLNDSDKEHIDNLNRYIEVFKYPDRDIDKASMDALSTLQTYIGQSKIVEIDYLAAYKKEVTTRQIEPLGLCFYGAHWHLVAFCRLRHDYRDFRVSRIQKIAPTQIHFEVKNRKSIQDFVNKMQQTEDLKSVIIIFKRSTADLIIDHKYYYGLVSEQISEKFVTMQFLVSSYAYFAKWILSLPDKVDIVSPTELKKLIRQQAETIWAHYGSD